MNCYKVLIIPILNHKRNLLEPIQESIWTEICLRFSFPTYNMDSGEIYKYSMFCFRFHGNHSHF